MVGPPPEAIGWRLFYDVSQYMQEEANMIGRRLVVGFSLVSLVAFHSLLFATLLHGFDEKHLQQLKKTNHCQKCDLTGAKLANLDLSYADLSSANLSNADLSGATFYGANLSGAVLINANLSNANLYEADLTKANLTGANVTNANLYNATWTNGKACKIGSTGVCKQ